MRNAHLVVWEHVCGRFFVLINIIDVCMMSEVVWKFFLLLFALLFAKSFCSAFVCFGCGKLVRNAHLVVWEHMCGRFLLLINIFDVGMMSEVVWKFFLLLFALLFAKSFLCGVCVFWLWKTCAQYTTSCLGACVR